MPHVACRMRLWPRGCLVLPTFHIRYWCERQQPTAHTITKVTGTTIMSALTRNLLQLLRNCCQMLSEF
jgi:hypothetical protein